MSSPPDDTATKDERPRRKWTDFEATVLMNLIIRNVHRTGLEKDEFSKLADSTAPHKKHRNARRAKEVADPDKLKYVDVATALNRALHKSDYTNDIPVEEVEKLLHFFLRDRKGAIAVIDRQPTARLTRSLHRIWNRGLNFLGTKDEWDNGRKAAEEVKRREDQERRLNVGNAGAITADANATGVHDGWGDDTAAAPAGDGWGTAANENSTDTPAAVAAWGDLMDIDVPAKTADNPKVNHENSGVEANSGAWGSNTADSSSAAANTADPWGATESIVEPSLTTVAWGEPEASQTATSTVATAADWSANEDPFATPLPPSLSDAVNKATAARGDPGASTVTNNKAAVESDPWNETSASLFDPVSTATNNAWGSTGTNHPTTVLPSIAKDGPAKTAYTVADPWSASAETTLPSFHNTGGTTADPWGTSATSSQIQPLDWGTEASSVVPANLPSIKSAQQAGQVGISLDKATSMGSAPWGEPVDNTRYQPVTTTIGGWGDDFERTRSHTSQTATAADFSHNESGPATTKDPGQAQWNKAPAPAPPVWNPAPKASNTQVANLGSVSTSEVAKTSSPSGLDPSNDFQTPSLLNSNQGIQVAGSGINPDRLAMLAAAETDDNEGSDIETTADAGFDRGKKDFKSSTTFGSKDNAIPLKFNRLAGK